MNNIDHVQNALHSWFTTATGLTAVWSHQNSERPPYPYGVLTLVSYDDNVQAYDGIETNSGNSTMEISGIRRMSIGCEVIGKDRSVNGLISKASQSFNNPFAMEVFRKRQEYEITVSSASAGTYQISLYGVLVSFVATALDTVTTIRDGLYSSLVSSTPLVSKGFLFDKVGADKVRVRWRPGYIFDVTVSSKLSVLEKSQGVEISRINEDAISSVPIEYENGWLYAGRFDAHFYYVVNQIVPAVPIISHIEGTINDVEVEII